MEQETRKWKGSHQQGRHRGIPNQNAARSSPLCPSHNLTRDSTLFPVKEDGLTDIIENAFENRPRSLVGRRSEYYVLPIHESDDASMLTMDEALDPTTANSSKSSLWNRSSRIPTPNENSIPNKITQLLPDNFIRFKQIRYKLFIVMISILLISSVSVYFQRLSLDDLQLMQKQKHVNQWQQLHQNQELHKQHMNRDYYGSDSSQVRQFPNNSENKTVLTFSTTPLQLYRQQPDSVAEYSPQLLKVQDTRVTAATGWKSPLDVTDRLNGFKDLWEPHESTDLPVFWHVPKSGGSTVKSILNCYRLILASEAGITNGHGEENKLAVVHITVGLNKPEFQYPFVNIDSTTKAGLQRAKTLGLAHSGLAEAMVTPFLYDANMLFDEQHRGRMFSIFRHPVERQVSLFYYLQYADWEPTYNSQLANMTIEDYAQSSLFKSNWLTRTLVNKQGGEEKLTAEDLKVAMDIVRRKILVGLLSKKEETMERFEKYFGWKYRINPKIQEECRTRLLIGSGVNANKQQNKREVLQPGTQAYDLLAWGNVYDMQLYSYIETLFLEQHANFSAIS